ncbi:MAG: hypothetical protein NZ528_16310 [Caldilineales bacterium]|nr:hypothetical protein [Caldilineales bacterium]MDW8319052.1 hypothetical protein [Anaerolineae bacterium]
MPILTEDPTGDALDPNGNPGSANDDIVRGWVASGVTPGGMPSLLFLVVMAGAPAASATKTVFTEYPDPDVLAAGDPNAHFYQVQSAPGVPSTLPSNRMGLFKFALAPGDW